MSINDVIFIGLVVTGALIWTVALVSILFWAYWSHKLMQFLKQNHPIRYELLTPLMDAERVSRYTRFVRYVKSDQEMGEPVVEELKRKLRHVHTLLFYSMGAFVLICLAGIALLPLK